MAFDQTYCMDTLTEATKPTADTGEFIFAFLEAYGFPRATIEWFDVELDTARDVVKRIVDGTIVQYRMDNTTGRLVAKSAEH